MEVPAVLSVEGLVEGDVVVPSNDYLGLEVGLLQPLYSFVKLLICQDDEGDCVYFRTSDVPRRSCPGSSDPQHG